MFNFLPYLSIPVSSVTTWVTVNQYQAAQLSMNKRQESRNTWKVSKLPRNYTFWKVRPVDSYSKPGCTAHMSKSLQCVLRTNMVQLQWVCFCRRTSDACVTCRRIYVSPDSSSLTRPLWRAASATLAIDRQASVGNLALFAAEREAILIQ